MEKRLPFYIDVDGFRLPGAFYSQAFRDTVQYKPRDDDVFIVTFPKCGTTWMQYIAHLIYNKGEPPKSVKDWFLWCPFLELVGTEAIASMPRPGTMKTHLPFNLQPYSPKAKFIYVVRNPKDCCVSFFHHTQGNFAYKFVDGTFDEYFEIFISGENDYGDYFDHVLSWYEHRNDPNVFFVTYEELKTDFSKVIPKLARFLGEEYGTMVDEDPEIVEKIKKFSSVEFMKSELDSAFDEKTASHVKHIMTPALKHVFSHAVDHNKDFSIVRKGIVGDWRSVFSEDQNRRINEKMEEKLKGTDLLKYWKDNNCV